MKPAFGEQFCASLETSNRMRKYCAEHQKWWKTEILVNNMKYDLINVILLCTEIGFGSFLSSSSRFMNFEHGLKDAE